MKQFRFVTCLALAASALGCSSQSLSKSDEPEPQGDLPQVQVATLTEVYRASAKVPLSATALAFNAAVEGELWVILRQFPTTLPCTLTVDTGCSALRGMVGVVSDATGSAPHGVIKEDGNSWHFMRRPTAIAWGDGEIFSTCGEGLTDNYLDDATPYAGPVLWSSSPAIFGVEPSAGQNGTHLDMLHETPYCMGIAHEADNVFWAFNGDAGSLDRVDFHAPHQIGGEDHSDGEVHRYATGQLKREPEVPSHLAYDQARHLVYVADTGNARVLGVDPSTATAGGDIEVYEELHSTGAMDGTKMSVLADSSLLQKPSGLALSDDALYVTDNATSLVYKLDTTGKPLAIWNTGLPGGSLAGITVGPDGKLYVADLLTGSVQRIEGP